MYLSMTQSCLQRMKGYLIWFTFVFAFTHSYALASTNVKNAGATGNAFTDDTRAIQPIVPRSHRLPKRMRETQKEASGGRVRAAAGTAPSLMLSRFLPIGSI